MEECCPTCMKNMCIRIVYTITIAIVLIIPLLIGIDASQSIWPMTLSNIDTQNMYNHTLLVSLVPGKISSPWFGLPLGNGMIDPLHECYFANLSPNIGNIYTFYYSKNFTVNPNIYYVNKYDNKSANILCYSANSVDTNWIY